MSFFTSRQAVALPIMPHTSSEASWNLFGPLMTEYSTVVNLISLICVSADRPISPPELVTDLRIARPWSNALRACHSSRDFRFRSLDVEEHL